MHDWYSLLDKHLLYPAYYLYAGDPKLKHLKDLEHRQYWSIDKLQAWQLQRVQAMVKHAYETVPFYKSLYRSADIAPEDIRSLQDFETLPCISKKDIQSYGDHFISSQYQKSELVADASGGSTGTPTHFYKDKTQYQLRAADQVRHDRWSGWDIGDPYALIWGAQKDIEAIQSWKQRILTKYIHRILPLDAFDLTPEKMLKFADVLEEVQPPMILGYANALATFAEFLLSNKPDHGIRPRGIISSAETLSAEKRKLIEECFKTKVLNRYGSREVGLMASECQLQTGLHINADNVFLEIGNFAANSQPLKETITAGPDDVFDLAARSATLCNKGESGEIIVTDFWNFGMPFIRYRMGDEGTRIDKKCGCSRTLPLMGEVSGRVSDFIIAMNGRRIHGEYFTHLFYDIPAVKKFQLIQETLDRITLKLVTHGQEVDQSSLVTAIQEVCGKDVKVEFIICEDIPPTASGKYLFTISKVSR